MSDYIRNLIELLRSGNYEDASEKIGLLSAALKEDGGVDAALIVSLLMALLSALMIQTRFQRRRILAARLEFIHAGIHGLSF